MHLRNTFCITWHTNLSPLAHAHHYLKKKAKSSVYQEHGLLSHLDLSWGMPPTRHLYDTCPAGHRGAGARKALAHTRAALTSRTELHQGLFCIWISDRHLAEATLQSREWELPCCHRGVRPRRSSQWNNSLTALGIKMTRGPSAAVRT